MQLRSDVRVPSAMSLQAWQKLGAASPAPVPQLEPSTWVKLFNPPTAFSFDEAWLLCQYDHDHWLAWIPDYGEILLHVSEFGPLEDQKV